MYLALYLLQKLLSIFNSCVTFSIFKNVNIQNSYTKWSSNEYYNGNYVRKLKRYHFVFSFVICFLSLLLLMVTLLPGKCISSPQTSCFLWADLRDPAPSPPKTRKSALFVCSLLFVVVERSDGFQVRSVIVVLLEPL